MTEIEPVSLYEAHASLARGLVRVHDLHFVLDVLTMAGIEALAFKGPVLDADLRGDPFVRDSDDLDLLVRRKDVAPALEALGAEGWAPALDVHPRTWTAFLRCGCEVPLVRPGRALLDLHWDLAPLYFAWRPDADSLRARARRVTVEGRPVPTLSRADTFLHLCAHGCLSDWTREMWVEDVALALARMDGAEAALVAEEARRTGGLRMTGVAVELARRRFGVEAPAALRGFVDGPAVALADLYAGVLAGTRRLPPTAPGRTALHLRARERLRDRAAHVAGLLQTPAVGEWGSPPVPAPVRWTRRLARGVRGAL